MDAICVGNATVDVFILLDKEKSAIFDKFANQISFRLGEKIPLDEYEFSIGGNACNVSVGLSRLGIKTGLCAEVGRDEFSLKLVELLKKEGVDLRLIQRDKREVPYFNIVLSYKGERTIFVEESKHEKELTTQDFSPKLLYLTSLSGKWKEDYENVLKNLKENTLLAFNPGTSQIEEGAFMLKIFPRTDIFIVNLEEAQKITKVVGKDLQIDGIKNIMTSLKKMGPKIVVITNGLKGSYAADDNSFFKIGAFSQKPAVERTGAGDSYSTGFLYAIMEGREVSEAMRYGSANADSVVSEVGAQKGLLSKNEIEKRLRQKEDYKANEF